MSGPGGKPELVIPVRFDIDKVLAMLKKLEQEGGDSLDKTAKSAKSLGDHIANFVSHQGLQLLQSAAQGLEAGFRATSDHIKNIAKEFTDLQDALRLIATFKGEKPTEQFTVATAQAGAAAGLSPQEWMNFEKQFQGFAGQFIGDGKKLSAEQGNELERRAAAFMSMRGIDAAQGGAIFGEILQQAKPGESTDDLMKKFGQSYVMLEAAKGDPGQLLGQIGTVTAEGVDVLTASKLMRASAQRDPGEAGTYVRTALRGIRGLSDVQQKELGITENMDIFAKITAIQNAAEKAGGDENKFLEKYFKDSRESGGVKAMIEFGNRGGLFAAADKEAAGITGTTDVTAVDEFKASQLGRRKYLEAERQVARVASGARVADLADLKKEAETQLEKEHRFEDMTGWGDMLRGVGQKMGAPEIREQIINERALQIARERSGSGNGVLSGVSGIGDDQYTMDHAILTELRKANEREDRKADRTPPPLAAKPAAPRTR